MAGTSLAQDEAVVKENARSVAGRPLPSVPKEHKGDGSGTILLFYQYKEPVWTEKEHKSMIKKVIGLGEKCQIQGRGRVAPEGVNITASSTNPQSMRAFCEGLRAMDPVFFETDFKLTDGVPPEKLFKSLSIRKTLELVAYGLAGELAPSIKHFAGQHLEAVDYHKAMADKDTVIVDVRNQYESAIGHFNPPEGGAELIDPRMRNSIEFPKWLANPETKKKLHNKKVLMYCTGGIRCERASALLNQMSAAKPDECKPKGVYELRGGIERYVKTFPTGGFWKGKNYLFDRRAEQCPGNKSLEQIEGETDSKCCLCRNKWTVYRGKFKCCKGLCGVPVIVCDACKPGALVEPQLLTCELCKAGYRAPKTNPDLAGLKRKAEAHVHVSPGEEPCRKSAPTKQPQMHEGSSSDEESKPTIAVNDRLFLGRLPLTVTKTKLAQVLGGEIKLVHWMTDRQTGAFYGSCLVQLDSANVAAAVLDRTVKIDKKKVKVSLARAKEGEMWPPDNYQEREYPPVGRG
jgi:predicted sulfurtransferase